MSGLLSLYSFGYPTVLAYMLQNSDYLAGPYIRWYWRTQNFNRVAERRILERTMAVRLVLLLLRLGMLMQLVGGIALIALWYWYDLVGGWQFGLALLLSYPIVWAHLVLVPLMLGRWLFVNPYQRRLVNKSHDVYANFKGTKIAIAGSYGKTSMKELLLTVLSKGKKVAAIQGNKNAALAHARFTRTLSGDENILLIEFGGCKPGDVKRFTATIQPTHVVIAGLSPNCLDRYRTIKAAGKDIFSAAASLPGKRVYVNKASNEIKSFITGKKYQTYDEHGALGWKASDIKVSISGTTFTLHKDKHRLKLTSKLLGKHQVGPLSLAAALALEFGLTDEQVKAGIAETAPFEHRMQPYQMSGAWIIDDTYSGNLDGVKAGTELLKSLPARRKWYVSPGLVVQGRKTRDIHHAMGRLIAHAQPDVVVLMENAAASFIIAGLRAAEFKHEVTIEKDPHVFYANLPNFIAAGDLVLMQNDWADRYL